VRGTPLRFLRDPFCLDVANRPPRNLARPRKQAREAGKHRSSSTSRRKGGA
jgi:hypothetical protein